MKNETKEITRKFRKEKLTLEKKNTKHGTINKNRTDDIKERLNKEKNGKKRNDNKKEEIKQEEGYKT